MTPLLSNDVHHSGLTNATHPYICVYIYLAPPFCVRSKATLSVKSGAVFHVVSFYQAQITRALSFMVAIAVERPTPYTFTYLPSICKYTFVEIYTPNIDSLRESTKKVILPKMAMTSCVFLCVVMLSYF